MELINYTPRTQPRQHQIRGLQSLDARPRHPDVDAYAWLMEMGTGKSKVVLDEWCERVSRGELHDLLVIAPSGSYRNWDLDRGPDEPSELTKHLDPGLRARIAVAAWVSGAGVTYQRTLQHFLGVRDRPRVLVVNVEAMSTVEAARQLCTHFLGAPGRRSMLAVDEVTTIRNESKRTKAVLKLGELADAKRILTGLLTPRSPMDVYWPFYLLDWRILGYRSFYGFRKRYAILQQQYFNNRRIEVEVGYRNLDELREKMAPWSYRVTKDECLDLDPKTWVRRDVPLSTEQKRLYKGLVEEANVLLSGETYISATSVLTQIMRLQQLVCGHVTDENGDVHAVPEQRTAALLDVLSEHDGKAIIWATFDYSIRQIAAKLRETYGDDSVACFWGGNASTRAQDEARFKTDPNCRFMVSTQAAGGRGNTWVGASLAIYFANNYDLEMRSQSEDRNHRMGQTRPVTYVDLVTRGTVDEKILTALRRKMNLASTLTGENFREWLI